MEHDSTAVMLVVPLTQLVLRQRQVLVHQALGGAEGRVHSAADQPGHSAVQHRADTPAHHSPGPLHPALHRAPRLLHGAGQSVRDRVLGAGHRACHDIFSAGYHILGTGNDLLRDKHQPRVGEETVVGKHRTETQISPR